ncbi:MAG: PqqD family peptide modification chaperone, partial [Acidimicrobiales bacterium]
LNTSAGVLFAACGEGGTLDELADELAPATGMDPAALRADLVAGLAELTEAGLLGRDVPVPEPEVAERSPVSGAVAGLVHTVVDDAVRFHSDDPTLVAAADLLLASMAVDRPATVDLGLAWADDGSGAVRLSGHGPVRTYASLDALLHALPTALNQLAATGDGTLTLHAGAVRAVDGSVLLLPAVSGSGKTTLTAALVQAGWGYLSDEAVGVRADPFLAVPYPKPLVLDATSRAALGLPPSTSPNVAPGELHPGVDLVTEPAGPIGQVVVPRYESGAEATLEWLAPAEAVVAVLEHVLNLARVGQPGLEVLCRLVEEVPVARLTHGGATSAVVLLSQP